MSILHTGFLHNSTVSHRFYFPRLFYLLPFFSFSDSFLQCTFQLPIFLKYLLVVIRSLFQKIWAFQLVEPSLRVPGQFKDQVQNFWTTMHVLFLRWILSLSKFPSKSFMGWIWVIYMVNKIKDMISFQRHLIWSNAPVLFFLMNMVKYARTMWARR